MVYSTVLRIFINIFQWSGTAHNWRRGVVKTHVNLKRWLCHVVEFDLYLVTFKPNCACLFYYWPVHSMFNRQFAAFFFMNLCYNKSICYKQDSQLFTICSVCFEQPQYEVCRQRWFTETRWIAALVVIYSPTRWICVYWSKLFQDVHTRRLTCICFQALRIQELSSTLDI